jgi:hypothetical protein
MEYHLANSTPAIIPSSFTNNFAVPGLNLDKPSNYGRHRPRLLG